MLIRFVLLFVAVGLSAATVSNVTVDNLTYSQVRIQWNTSENMNGDYVEWGVATGTYLNRTTTAGASDWSTNHGITFVVPGSTTIYYRVCSTVSSTACSSEGTFTTEADPATEADEPVSFTPATMPSMPASWDDTYFVDAAACNSNQTGVKTGGWQWAMDQARASTLPDNNNILIKVPAGLECDFGTTTYKLTPNVRTGGTKPAIWIVSSTWIDTPSAVPPEGVRLTSDWPDSIFATAIPSCSNCPAIDFVSGAASDVTKWYFRGIRFKRKPVAGTDYKTVTAATNTSPIVITTSTAHSGTTGDYVQIWDCAGNTGANTLHAQMTVLSSTTFSVDNSVGNGALSGTCKVHVGPPNYNGYALIQMDDNVAASADPTNLRIKNNGFDQIKVEGAVGEGMTAPLGMLLDYGSGVVVKNSYLKGTYRWNHIGDPTQTNNTGEALDITGSKDVTVCNNYINWPGISVFNQTSSNGSAENHYICRNLMEWDEAWMVGSATSNGLRGFVRQQMEWKAGKKVWVVGNTIKNTWVCCGQTGNAGGSTIVFSPRSSDSLNILNSSSVISDINVQYNWIKNAAGCIYAHGADLENLARDVRGVQRILIEHNLCTEIDARTRGSIDGSAVIGVGFYLGLDGSDWIVRNNTLVDVRGSSAAPIYWYNARGARGVFENNLFAGANKTQVFSWISSSAGFDMIPALVDMAAQSGTSLARFQDAFKRVAGGATSGIWRNNMIIPGVADGTSYATVGGITTATCDLQFPGTDTVCLGGTGDTPNARLALLKMPYFAGFSADNLRSFKLRYDSPGVSGYTAAAYCVSNPTRCLNSRNKMDIGADLDRMAVELGQVLNPRAFAVTTTTAKIGYIAPDSFACTVEYGTSATWGTGSRVADSGGARVRTVDLTGLTTGTTYYWRLLCASEQPSGSFKTL